MSLMLATLVLNEMEWLPRLYDQHKDWPEMVSWVFVEGADRIYAETTPDRVSPEGLSVDGTSRFLRELASKDPRVVYIPHGFSSHSDPAQGKCQSRQRYLDVAETVRPEYLLVLDGDEFYPQSYQPRILQMFRDSPKEFQSFRFRQREIWHPPSLSHEPLFAWEVVGGFWGIVHCRGWRWSTGLRYVNNHNTPETPQGKELTDKLRRFDKYGKSPVCVHMAFASNSVNRVAKNRYYEARGEGKTDHRKYYVESRAAFSTWKPGEKLPHGAAVIPYKGPIPEVFLGGNDVTR